MTNIQQTTETVDSADSTASSTKRGPIVRVVAGLASDRHRRATLSTLVVFALAESLRLARVAILIEHNPLGLAYTAFGLPKFALQRAAA